MDSATLEEGEDGALVIEHVLSEGKSLYVRGECIINVAEGVCELRGARLGAGSSIRVYEVDYSCMDVLFVQSDARLKIRYLSKPKKLRTSLVSPFHLSKSWVDVSQILSTDGADEQSRTIMVAGEKGSGKSTFVRYLLNRLLQTNACVAVVDVDVGQPLKGPCGLISLAIYDKYDFGEEDTRRHSIVIGEVSPSGVEVEFMKGVVSLLHLVRRFRNLQRMPLVVNSFGWMKNLGAQYLDAICAVFEITDFVWLHPDVDDGGDLNILGLPGASFIANVMGTFKGVLSREGVRVALPYLRSSLNACGLPTFMTHKIWTHQPSGSVLKRHESPKGLTSRSHRMLRLTRALFPIHCIVTTAAPRTLDDLNKYIRTRGFAIALQNIRFMAAPHLTGDLIQAQYLDQIVYLAQSPNVFLSLAVVTDIDWSTDTLYLYTPHHQLTLSHSKLLIYKYPEGSMPDLLEGVSIMQSRWGFKPDKWDEAESDDSANSALQRSQLVAVSPCAFRKMRNTKKEI